MKKTAQTERQSPTEEVRPSASLLQFKQGLAGLDIEQQTITVEIPEYHMSAGDYGRRAELVDIATTITEIFLGPPP